MAEKAPNNTDNSNSDSEFGNDENPNPNSSSNNALAVNGFPSSSLVCLVKFAGDTATGAVMGAIFGYGVGLYKKQGFKGAFTESAASAKTFAALSGVHGLVVCLLKRIRGKDDVINSGVAGCCTGLAVTYPGAPGALLQSCLMFGGFAVAMEVLNKKQPAMAHSYNTRSSSNAIPPLAFPLSDELKGPFLSFCQSLSKSKKGNHPFAA
ncbi:hypothetical protein SOVF_092230 [Spinacia oleracea]|uniref:Mitochondrial import inner membrane translocase subunit TIM22-3 n=1 Tax=Spinacia oleracea TaxID=3562 RepID=A0A9R0IC63_SPIOL|nr:mitochondrial import inner membrane translocase subunit TIM22-3 [Spinacia oleracea]KNA16105.1 hypothetical protein SOVF_092230 [Spinacia oleracea]